MISADATQYNTGISMKVNISKAAKMVGVDRSTFYRHVDEKGITLDKTNAKRPLVDVSELIRVYGDKVKSPDQIRQDNNPREVSHSTPSNTSMEEQIELHTLREKVKHLEEIRETEKRGLEEQIDILKKQVESERTERQRATALLTDQSENKKQEDTRLSNIEKSIQTIHANQTRSWRERIFGSRKAS